MESISDYFSSKSWNLYNNQTRLTDFEKENEERLNREWEQEKKTYNPAYTRFDDINRVAYIDMDKYREYKSKEHPIQTIKDYKPLNEFQTKLKTLSEHYFKDYEKGNFYSLFIGGSNGIGKSYFMDLIFNKFKAEGATTLKVNYFELMQEIKSCLKNGEEENNYRQLMERLKHVQILFIDDFIKPSCFNQADLKYLYQIINYRYEQEYITLYTSELLLAEVKKIDEALGGRILESCSIKYCVAVNNENLNLRKGR